jgi:hypothetical protein
MTRRTRLLIEWDTERRLLLRAIARLKAELEDVEDRLRVFGGGE